MDKQTKIIIGLLIFIMVLTMIFVLKVTGVVKPIGYNQFLSVEGIGIIKFEINNELTIGGFIKYLSTVLVILTILVGVYKAYVKIGMPETLLQFEFFIIPIFIMLAMLAVAHRIFSINAFLIVIAMMLVAEVVIAIIINAIYFKYLDIAPEISILAAVPLVASFLPFLAIIAVVCALVLLVYEAIAIGRLAKCFGKGNGFAVGMFLLPFIFIPILGYSDEYVIS